MATRMPGTHYYKQVSHYSFEVFFIFQISTNNSLYVIILRRQPYFLPSLIFWLGYHGTNHFATMILITIFSTVSLSLNIIIVFSSVIYDRHVWVLSHSGMSNSLLLLDCSPPGSSVHGICQARVLECTASSSSRRSSQPRIKPASHASPALAGSFSTTEPPGKAHMPDTMPYNQMLSHAISFSQGLSHLVHFFHFHSLPLIRNRFGKYIQRSFWRKAREAFIFIKDCLP